MFSALSLLFGIVTTGISAQIISAGGIRLDQTQLEQLYIVRDQSYAVVEGVDEVVIWSEGESLEGQMGWDAASLIGSVGDITTYLLIPTLTLSRTPAKAYQTTTTTIGPSFAKATYTQVADDAPDATITASCSFSSTLSAVCTHKIVGFPAPTASINTSRNVYSDGTWIWYRTHTTGHYNTYQLVTAISNNGMPTSSLPSSGSISTALTVSPVDNTSMATSPAGSSASPSASTIATSGSCPMLGGASAMWSVASIVLSSILIVVN